MDDLLQELGSKLRRAAVVAEARDASLGEIRLLVMTLRNRGFAVELDPGADAYRFAVRIDLCGARGAGPADRAKDLPAVPGPAAMTAPPAAPAPVAPTVAPAPAKPAPRPATAPSAFRLTDDQKKTIVTMTQEGAGPVEIADHLGIGKKTVANFKARHKHLFDGAAPAVPAPKAEPAPAPEPAPRPTSQPAKELRRARDLPENAPSKQRQIAASLNALGYAGTWTPEADLKMVLMIGRGEKADRVAADLRIKPNDVLSRWRAVNTAPGDMAHQAELVAVLKYRAGV